jgi:hypothetical protein
VPLFWWTTHREAGELRNRAGAAPLNLCAEIASVESLGHRRPPKSQLKVDTNRAFTRPSLATERLRWHQHGKVACLSNTGSRSEAHKMVNCLTGLLSDALTGRRDVLNAAPGGRDTAVSDVETKSNAGARDNQSSNSLLGDQEATPPRSQDHPVQAVIAIVNACVRGPVRAVSDTEA